MATIEIPVNPKLVAQSFSVNLSSVRYLLKIYWNIREERWYMDLWLDSETPIFTNQKILSGWVPFRIFRRLAKHPKGSFVVTDSDPRLIPPGRDEFGTNRRVKLLFVEDE